MGNALGGKWTFKFIFVRGTLLQKSRHRISLREGSRFSKPKKVQVCWRELSGLHMLLCQLRRLCSIQIEGRPGQNCNWDKTQSELLTYIVHFACWYILLIKSTWDKTNVDDFVVLYFTTAACGAPILVSWALKLQSKQTAHHHEGSWRFFMKSGSAMVGDCDSFRFTWST